MTYPLGLTLAQMESYPKVYPDHFAPRSLAAAIKAWSSVWEYFKVVVRLLCPNIFPTVARLTPLVVSTVAHEWRRVCAVTLGSIRRAALAKDKPLEMRRLTANLAR